MEDQCQYDAAPLGFVVQPVAQDPQRFVAGLMERDRVDPVPGGELEGGVG